MGHDFLKLRLSLLDGKFFVLFNFSSTVVGYFYGVAPRNSLILLGRLFSNVKMVVPTIFYSNRENLVLWARSEINGSAFLLARAAL